MGLPLILFGVGLIALLFGKLVSSAMTAAGFDVTPPKKETPAEPEKPFAKCPLKYYSHPESIPGFHSKYASPYDDADKNLTQQHQGASHVQR